MIIDAYTNFPFKDMVLLTQLFTCTKNSKFLVKNTTTNLACVRYASKKSSTSTRNAPIRTIPKHRGWRVQDGHYVKESTILATQLKPRFHPGLYVGFGKNGTLYALESGKVMITCEKINPNMSRSWARLNYADRENNVIYKKHFNVIPESQHNRFVLIDTL
ncbi:39S ribosomal protein L27, mitochondrial isoform X1 [Apis mellifera caucasica]|uniref:Large ribosomal subunit protein bL27m n=2 Tax=Apis mellifera TaxID=7460 RepID=A0A7M7GWM4_APIME|nr:39S ribosomal protein L27, mitochondrial isoform X1 [Apis mellifera]KAG6802045.1 39S ribosomal protein L27, mitochondrial isoform X1 [Apis mellifera caucasica]KAG9432386.1 39S ribosomal protein L27, mitochondrial isoform X1 [Apis mellifera carnica]|eukprot:XP_006562040.1 39S ribosomal protein L27, mitochondrial isoform X1 [Apis mellifera]